MTKVKDYYNILNVEQDADEETIKRAYQMMAKQQPDGEKAFREAAEVLTNPKKRAQYDDYMSKNGNGTAAQSAPANGNVQRWDYMTLESSKNYGTTKYYIDGDMKPELKNGVFINIMKMLGAEGWELVGISTVGSEQTFVFKRPTDEIYEMPSDGPAA